MWREEEMLEEAHSLLGFLKATLEYSPCPLGRRQQGLSKGAVNAPIHHSDLSLSTTPKKKHF